MTLPVARISHHTPQRVRFKIPEKRKNLAYFADVVSAFSKHQNFKEIQVNPLTGSILLIDEYIDLEALLNYASINEFFTVEKKITRQVVPLSHRIVQPIKFSNTFIERTTGGFLDIPGIAFLALMGTGIWHLAKGNLKAPQWHTAFWYSLGIFSSLLANKVKDSELQKQAG
jgi:hypothetical protein